MKYYFFTLPDTYGGNIIYISSDGCQFPDDESNRNYKEYLAWVAEGNIAEEWNPNGNQ